MTQADGSAGGHVVVVGGSMAGLLAAAACARHARRVTIVERDVLDDAPGHRRGVPQDHMLHVLLPAGLALIDDLVPGYSGALRDAGAVPVNLTRDAAVLQPPGWVDRRAPGFEILSASRPLLEATARRGVLAHPAVGVLAGTDVAGLRTDAAGRVSGVDLRRAGAAGVRHLDADLVVDATGRGSRAPAWLRAIGVTPPRETTIDADIAYACRPYRIPPGWDRDWDAVLLFPDPPAVPRTGYLVPVEGDRWIAGLMGAAGQHPPTDDDGFLAFARSLRHPVLADAIAAAEPLGPARAYHGTANRRRHYERIAMPEGFVVLGDAVCAINPMYGQGITVAARGATLLDACLRRAGGPAGTGLSRSFQRRLALRVFDPWLLATNEDLRSPATTGGRAVGAHRLLHRYTDRVVAATTRGPVAAQSYLRVLGLLDRPTALFSPAVVGAAARAGAPRRPPTDPPPPHPDRAPARGGAA